MGINNNGDKAVIPLIINNESVVTDTTFEVHNPATGELLDRCAGASVNDANHAVATARAAFPSWSKTSPYERRAILTKAADVMASRKEELIRYQMEETGAGRMFTEKTFQLGVDFLRNFAAMIPTVEGKVPTIAHEGESAMVVKQPYGVVLGIAPWYVFLC
jgi:acyl-CoA reductase-like NAD-dependent aldehyde dehydrogenase